VFLSPNTRICCTIKDHIFLTSEFTGSKVLTSFYHRETANVSSMFFVCHSKLSSRYLRDCSTEHNPLQPTRHTSVEEQFLIFLFKLAAVSIQTYLFRLNPYSARLPISTSRTKASASAGSMSSLQVARAPGTTDQFALTMLAAMFG
jgi:hypothetical protein